MGMIKNACLLVAIFDVEIYFLIVNYILIPNGGKELLSRMDLSASKYEIESEVLIKVAHLGLKLNRFRLRLWP